MGGTEKLLTVEIPADFWTLENWEAKRLAKILQSAIPTDIDLSSGQIHEAESIATMRSILESRNKEPEDMSPFSLGKGLLVKPFRVRHRKCCTLADAIAKVCVGEPLYEDKENDPQYNKGLEAVHLVGSEKTSGEAKYQHTAMDGFCTCRTRYTIDYETQQISSVTQLTFPESALTDAGKQFLRKFEGHSPSHFIIGAIETPTWRQELTALLVILSSKIKALDDIAATMDDKQLERATGNLSRRFDALSRKIKLALLDRYDYCFQSSPPQAKDFAHIACPVYIFTRDALFYYDGLGCVEQVVVNSPEVLAKLKTELSIRDDGMDEQLRELSDSQFSKLIETTHHTLEGGNGEPVALKKPRELRSGLSAKAKMNIIDSVAPYLTDLHEVVDSHLKVLKPLLDAEDRLLTHRDSPSQDEISQLQEQVKGLRARSKFARGFKGFFYAACNAIRELLKSAIKVLQTPSSLLYEGINSHKDSSCRAKTSAAVLGSLTEEHGLLLDENNTPTLLPTPEIPAVSSKVTPSPTSLV